MYQVPLVVYEELKRATLDRRRDILLSLIEEHPDHQLELPERDGTRADLRGVDLSRDALQEIVERRGEATPPWWDADLQGANLQKADLQDAILVGANLSFASLQGAMLIYANLQGAILWNANLQAAYLIKGKLQRANLTGVKLQDAKLIEADLQGADLTGARLQGALLRYADLQGANLRQANLDRANLRDARLQAVDLSRSVIGHCYLSGAWLDRTRLRREQLGGAVGEELDGSYAEARVAYLGLKQNFDTLGDYAASSWAYRKERRMEKREALEKAHAAHRKHDWKGELYFYAKVLVDQVVERVCDYGEGFLRVLVCLAVLWFDFALLYGITGHVLADRGPVYSTTRNVIDLLSFSLGTMVTLQVPGLRPFASLAMRILMPLEAALGIFFLGLLGFVAGNRVRHCWPEV